MAEEDLSLARDFAAKLQKLAEGVPLARVSALSYSNLHDGQREPGAHPSRPLPPRPRACWMPLFFSSLLYRIADISTRPVPPIKYLKISALDSFTHRISLRASICAAAAAAVVAALFTPVAAGHQASSCPAQDIAQAIPISILPRAPVTIQAQ